MQKRILIFSLAYYPSHVSGAEVAVKEITDRISPEDIAFSMVTHRFSRSSPRRERLGNVEVHRVGFGPSYLSKILFVPLAAAKAASLHRTQSFDGSWIMMTYMLFPLVLAKMLGLRGPYVMTLQDGDPYEKVFGRWFIVPLLPILNWGFRNATRVQAISTYLATWPKRRGYKYPVEMIPNGASVESAQQYPQEELAAMRLRLGKKEGDVLLLSIGRLEHQKAMDDVLRALALLPEHIRLIVAGEGRDKAALVALAKTLGVAHRVQWLGQLERQETAKLRQVCDLFVLPSRSEGQGISFLSTMAAGMPVIATQEGGLADFITTDVAWPVKKDSPQDIADAVNAALANPAEAAVRVEAARRLVRDKYDWEAIARAMQERVFNEALRGIVK